MASCSRCRELTEGRVARALAQCTQSFIRWRTTALIEVTRTFERRKLYKNHPVGEAILEKETERIRQLARDCRPTRNWWRLIKPAAQPIERRLGLRSNEDMDALQWIAPLFGC